MIAPYYDYLSNKDYNADVAFIKHIIDKFIINGNKILDIGCGTGAHSEILVNNGYDVLGIDKSKRMIEIALEKHPRLKFLVKDALKLKLNTLFDAVICMYGTVHYFKHIRDIKKAFKIFYNHTKKGGLVIVEIDFFKDSFDPDTSEAHNFDVGEIEGSIIKEYEDRGKELLFSYNVNIKDHGKVLRAIDTRKAPFLRLNEWKELLKDAGFKVSMEYNNKKPELIGLKI